MKELLIAVNGMGFAINLRELIVGASEPAFSGAVVALTGLFLIVYIARGMKREFEEVFKEENDE